jgi:Family of unknown function (DUF5681)
MRCAGRQETKRHMPDSDSDYKVGPGRPPLHTRFKKGQSGNPGGRSAKSLAAALAAALNERVYVTINGRRRKITKREAIVTQMVNKSAAADLRAIKMLTDMMKDIEKKASAESPPEPPRFAPADEEVVKGIVERIRGALLQEIQDMNAGNPALAMISLPPSSVPVQLGAG